MLMAAVVPRDTVVTYKPPRGTKVNLSTADHVTLADTGDALLRTCKGDPPLSEDESPPLNAQQSVRGYVVASKGGCSSSSSLPSPAAAAVTTGITCHLVTAELNHHSSAGSLSSLRHANSNGSVASLARAAITRANTLRSANSCPLRSSTSSSAALNRTGSLVRRHDSLSRTASLSSDAEDRRRTSILSTATEEINLAIPLDGDEEEEEEEEEEGVTGAGDGPRLTIVRSNSLNSLAFTPVIVSQQPPRLDQHGGPRPISPLPPTNVQLRRSGAMPDRARRAKNYRSTKNVSFDCDTRTETFETELTESETDDREFARLMGHYERRPHMRLPLSPDNEYCPPGKEEEDLLPKVLCFALALIITGGILYGLNLLIARMNMNLFSS